jgi:hypothetical protein
LGLHVVRDKRCNGVKQATNGTNDGSTAIVPSWLVLGVQLGQPLETSAASIEMVQGVGHLFVDEAEVTWVGKLLSSEERMELRSSEKGKVVVRERSMHGTAYQ